MKKKPRRKDFLIELTFLDKEAKSKGKWAINAFSGENDRLFIESMAMPPAVTEGTTEGTTTEGDEVKEGLNLQDDYNVFEFDKMTQSFQDKIYDYLDVVGVDDQLSHFIRQYPVRFENKSQLEFLQNLKKLMGH